MKSNKAKKPARKGRPSKDPILKYKTQLWYWSVKYKSQLSDGKLDLEFSDPEPDRIKRDYVDRIRIFEEVRKSGSNISNGTHSRRNFDLIDRVNSHPKLQGSAAVYESIIWDILCDKTPSLKETTQNFLALINTCNLSTIKLYQFDAPDMDALNKISKLTNLTPDRINQILENEINTNERKPYDDILQSFSNVSDFFDILDQVDFQRITQYLNQLAFYITFYRYAMLTGNFHALISAADSINEHLFLLLQDIEWLEKDFSKALFNSIHNRVFKNDSQRLEKLDEHTLHNAITAADENTALHKLSTLL